jgi:hypothetical protein
LLKNGALSTVSFLLSTFEKGAQYVLVLRMFIDTLYIFIGTESYKVPKGTLEEFLASVLCKLLSESLFNEKKGTLFKDLKHTEAALVVPLFSALGLLLFIIADNYYHYFFFRTANCR